jgi:uncharacterized protein (TIGR03000 family)
MRRNICLAGFVGMMALLLVADAAQAQWRGRGGRRSSGTYIGIGSDGVYGGYYSGRGGYYDGYGYGGYGRPYGRSYYGGNYYSSGDYDYGDNSISSYAPTQYSAAEESESGRPRDALVHIRVPQADARVFIEGQQTKQSGTERVFVSPPLEQGKDYNYTVKATWNDGGREVTREKTVTFRVGQEVGIDFTRMASNANTDQAPAPKRTVTPRTLNGEEQTSESGFLDNKAADNNSHEGKIVKVGDNKLTMTDKDGNKKHTHNVPATATITRDGKSSKLDDLKEGDMVTVTTSKNDQGKSLVVKIEAHSK